MSQLIGTGQNQVPLNGLLGTMAFQDKAAINVVNVNYTGTLTGGTGVVNLGSGQVYKDASGNVGIGTSSPAYKLDVNGAINASDVIRLTYPGGANSYYLQNAGTVGAGNAVLAFVQAGVAERMRIDSSGNLGLGVTPSAWGSSYKAIQLGAYSALYNTNSGWTGLSTSTYNNGTNWIYNSNNAAFRYEQDLTTLSHKWFTAPSGTAGNAIAFTQVMTLDANGRFMVGITAPYVTASGTSQGSFEYSQNGRTQLVISNQTNGASASAALVLGAYGMDWFIANGSTANNGGVLTFTRGAAATAMTLDGLGNITGATWTGTAIGIAYGGTGTTTSTGTGSNVLSASPTFTGSITTPSITFSDASTMTTAPQIMKNRVINGDMRIDQRLAGAAGIASTGTTYAIDRIQLYATLPSKLNYGQNLGAITPPTGFKNYFGVNTAVAVSLAASDMYFMSHTIEGINIADFLWGTASALPITVSFWAYSSLTGTFSGAILNSTGSKSYVFSYSMPTANTWTKIAITIPADTAAGYWLTDNSAGCRIIFSLGIGTSGLGTAGYSTATYYRGLTGTVNIVTVLNATYYITGLQVEKGSVATAFETRPYATELDLCQRYYNQGYFWVGTATTPAQGFFPNTMRVAPLLGGGGTGINNTGSTVSNFTCSQTTAAFQTLTFNSDNM